MSAKMVALVLGIIFVIVGLLGFVPNPLVGMGALFDANAVHNLLHLVIGLVLIGVAIWAPAQSAMWLKIWGAAYLVLAILGFVMTSPVLGIIEINGADNWLHIVLGVVLLAAGFWAKNESMSMGSPAPMNTGMGM
jgi:hypothetical protein